MALNQKIWATRFYRAVTCTAVPTMARYLPTVPTVARYNLVTNVHSVARFLTSHGVLSWIPAGLDRVWIRVLSSSYLWIRVRLFGKSRNGTIETF